MPREDSSKEQLIATLAERDLLLQELQTHQVELEAQNETLREAQGQLEASRRRYVDLYDFAPIPYLTLREDTSIVEANLAGGELLGRERSSIVGRPFAALVTLDDSTGFMGHLREALASASPVTAEISFTRKDAHVTCNVVSAAVRQGREVPTACRTAFFDITQQKRAAREALGAQESERRLRTRLETLDRATSALDAALAKLSGADMTGLLQAVVEQARVLVEAQYAAIGIGGATGEPFEPWVVSGVAPQEATAIGRTPRGVGVLGAVVRSQRSIRVREVQEHASSTGIPPSHPPVRSFLGVPIRYEGQSRGNLYFVNKQGAAEFSADDQAMAEMLADRVAMATEVVRLRQVEQRERSRYQFLARAAPLLTESLEDYQGTLQAIARVVVPALADVCAIDLVDEQDGGVREVAIHGADPSRQEALLQLLGKFRRVPDDILLAIETKRPLRRELGIVAPMILRGRVIGVLRLAMAESGRRYSDDDIPLAAEVARMAALAVNQATLYASARTAIEARDNLLAFIAHDVRNYLSTIRMAGELMSQAGPQGERRKGRRQLEAIKRAAVRMEHLIEGLRDASMIETGQFAVQKEPQEPAALAEEALRALEPQAEAASVRLALRVQDHPPRAHCDAGRVLQVLANLLGNALRFTPAGGEVSITVKPAADGVCISVSDTGCGIREEQLPHVFERHWRARPATRGSTGLGLFIAKGIVETHGGRIWVESKVGVGTTFSFTLPPAPDDAHRPPAQPA